MMCWVVVFLWLNHIIKKTIGQLKPQMLFVFLFCFFFVFFNNILSCFHSGPKKKVGIVKYISPIDLTNGVLHLMVYYR